MHTALASAVASLESCPGYGHYKGDTWCEIPAVVKVTTHFVFLPIIWLILLVILHHSVVIRSGCYSKSAQVKINPNYKPLFCQKISWING